jgi:hypothetical protein
MGAKYISDESDGYLSVRNNVYLDRGQKVVIRSFEHSGASRNLPEQSMENYGKTDYHKKDLAQ